MFIKKICKLLLPKRIWYLLGIRFSYMSEKQFCGEILRDRMMFYSQFVKEGDLYYDIGANIGNRVAPMLKLGAKVIAVEPQEICVKKMKKRFGDKIIVEQIGCGEKNTTLDFFESNLNFLSTFSVEQIGKVSDRFAYAKWKKTKKIQVFTLDTLIKKYGHPSFVKIDVEGYELQVLNGLSFPVKMLSFEYTEPEMHQNLIHCIYRIIEISKLYKFNYSIGETMDFALKEWVNKDDFLKIVNSVDFENTHFGDVYVQI